MLINHYIALFFYTTFVRASNQWTAMDVLRKVHFRVYAYEYPPIMSAVKDSDGNITTYEGFSVDFINYLAQHFELRVEYVLDKSEKSKQQGQVVSPMQAFARKESEIDFATLPIGPSIEVWYRVDLTGIAFQELYTLIVPWPQEEGRLTVVIRPFNLITWTVIIFSTLALVGIVTILPFIYYRHMDQRVEGTKIGSFSKIFGKSSMYVIAIFTQQGGSYPFQINFTIRSSLRIMLGLWLLMTVILINLYTSVLTSYHTVIKLKPIPNSLEELVSSYSEHKDQCLVTMQNKHPVLQKFYNATYMPYKQIGDWITDHPQYLTDVYKDITDNIVKYHCAHMGIPITSGFRIGNDLKTNGKCRMTTSKPLELSYSASFQLQKDGPYTSIVNHYLLRAISAGLVEQWKKWSTMSMEMCKLDNFNNKKNNKKKAGKVKSIKLFELSSAFTVLGVGLALSTLVFLLERCFGSFNFSR